MTTEPLTEFLKRNYLNQGNKDGLCHMGYGLVREIITALEASGTRSALAEVRKKVEAMPVRIIGRKAQPDRIFVSKSLVLAEIDSVLVTREDDAVHSPPEPSSRPSLQEPVKE